MHSLIYKEENAHELPTHCCTWYRKPPRAEGESAQDLIVTGGADSLVKVWEWKNNKLNLLHTLKGHDMSIVSVAISPDGYALASSSLESKLVIWDLESGQKAKVIQTGPTDLWTLVFSPDNQHVASGSHTGKIFVYNVQTGDVDGILDTRGKFVMNLAWSPGDGHYIASTSVDGRVYIFDAFMCKLIHTIETNTTMVRSVAFSMDSLLLLTGCDDGTLRIFNVTSGSTQGTIQTGQARVMDARFSADGKRVVAGSADGAVRIYTLKGIKAIHTFQEHSEPVWGVHFNASGNRIMSASKDKCINIYECPV